MLRKIVSQILIGAFTLPAVIGLVTPFAAPDVVASGPLFQSSHSVDKAFANSGDTLTYTVNDLRFTQTNNVFEWETNYGDEGIYAFTFTVSDGIENVSTTVNVYIDNLPLYIIITNPANNSIINTIAYNY